MSLVTRHHNSLWLNLASRCARLHFRDLQVPSGTRVRLTWMYCYDPQSAFPDWKELPVNLTETLTGAGGTADFQVVLGPDAPSVSGEASHIARLILARPTPAMLEGRAPDSPPLLPTLIYILQRVVDEEARERLVSGRLYLHAFWNETVFTEASSIFRTHAVRVGEEPDSLIDVRYIKDILLSTWTSRFSYLASSSKCEDDGECDEMPILYDTIVQRMIQIGTEARIPPAFVTGRAFCGASPTTGISIWRVLQNVMELVGRSLFIRELYRTGQLYLLMAEETIQIHTDKLAELGEPFVYFLRVPRSVVNEPAIVLEIFEVRFNVQGQAALKPVRPTPYLTSSQIAKAGGDIFKAASVLESVHSEILKQLTPRGLLQPPNISLCGVDPDHLTAIPISRIRDLQRLDPKWWSSPNP